MIGKNKDGILYYSVRYKDPQGVVKQKTVQNRLWTTKKEAKAAAETFILSMSKQTDNITVGQLYSIYIVEMERTLKLKSSHNIESIYRNNIEPSFGKIVVRNITPRMIAQWQTKLVEQGYNNSTLNTIQMKFRAILNYGVNLSYIEKSPFKLKFAQNQTQNKRDMEYWTPIEFKRFIRRVSDPMFHCFFTLLYWTGIRQGEAVALTIGDINFNDNTINVNKTFDPMNHVVTTPKTSNSVRKVPMTEELRNELSAQINWMKLIPGYDAKHILFGFDIHTNPTKIKNTQVKACNESGVKIIRIHELRHSHVSVLINNGYNSFEISKRLGHTPAMVENIYGHMFKKNETNMVNKLDAISNEAEEELMDTLRIN